MNKTKFILLAASFVFAIALFSCGNDSVNINGSGSNLYCDMGSDGCFEIRDASECYLRGEVVSICSNDPGGTIQPPQRQKANAIVITLKSWKTTYRKPLNRQPDPEIYFRVNGVSSGTVVSSQNSDVLLKSKGISSWSGSKKSLPVRFSESADSIRIDAIVSDIGVWDTDISPGYFVRIHSPLYEGKTGSYTLDYGSGKSKVSFDYEFIRW
jgi:hypothetical protein